MSSQEIGNKGSRGKSQKTSKTKPRGRAATGGEKKGAGHAREDDAPAPDYEKVAGYSYASAMAERDPILWRDLTRRRLAILDYIVSYVQNPKNRAKRPPTMEQVLDHLNRVLPPGIHGKAVSSKQQVQKWAMALREKGYVLGLEDFRPGEFYNLVPTEEGMQCIADYWAAVKARKAEAINVAR